MEIILIIIEQYLDLFFFTKILFLLLLGCSYKLLKPMSNSFSKVKVGMAERSSGFTGPNRYFIAFFIFSTFWHFCMLYLSLIFPIMLKLN